jgi:hypothetical protein
MGYQPPGRDAVRVSDYFKLGRTQGALEFVDVAIERDTRLFVDPRAFRALESDWGNACVDLITEFFNAVLQAIRAGDDDRARQLLMGLSEPNETRLGMSRERVRGRGVGPELADKLYMSLAMSEAVTSGLLKDLEDTALMVPGIGPDRISDVTTNIVRAPLIDYTRRMADKYGIPTEEVDSGLLWKPGTVEWQSEYVQLPVASGRRLLLVPRSVVRWKLSYDPGEYYRHYVLNFLADLERQKRSPLTWVLKSGPRKGERTVRKKDVERKYKRQYGTQKNMVVAVTRENTEILERYRARKSSDFGRTLDFTALAKRAGTPKPNWNKLLKAVTDCPRGNASAHAYHMAVHELLKAVFYPELDEGEIEREIDSGTRRIDLVYTNMLQPGFFAWFVAVYKDSPAPFISVECKNYKLDPKTPEVDQLNGRLNGTRGRLGLLVCRQIENRERFAARTQPLMTGNKNVILGLDDGDLVELVAGRKNNDDSRVDRRLRLRLTELVNA